MSDDHAPASDLKRSELAKLTGCNLETIRDYENAILMPDPPRTASGDRKPMRLMR